MLAYLLMPPYPSICNLQTHDKNLILCFTWCIQTPSYCEKPCRPSRLWVAAAPQENSLSNAEVRRGAGLRGATNEGLVPCLPRVLPCLGLPSWQARGRQAGGRRGRPKVWLPSALRGSPAVRREGWGVL